MVLKSMKIRRPPLHVSKKFPGTVNVQGGLFLIDFRASCIAGTLKDLGKTTRSKINGSTATVQ